MSGVFTIQKTVSDVANSLAEIQKAVKRWRGLGRAEGLDVRRRRPNTEAARREGDARSPWRSGGRRRRSDSLNWISRCLGHRFISDGCERRRDCGHVFLNLTSQAHLREVTSRRRRVIVGAKGYADEPFGAAPAVSGRRHLPHDGDVSCLLARLRSVVERPHQESSTVGPAALDWGISCMSLRCAAFGWARPSHHFCCWGLPRHPRRRSTPTTVTGGLGRARDLHAARDERLGQRDHPDRQQDHRGRDVHDGQPGRRRSPTRPTTSPATGSSRSTRRPVSSTRASTRTSAARRTRSTPTAPTSTSAARSARSAATPRSSGWSS